MFSNLEKHDKRKVVAFILIIALCVTMLPIISLGEDSESDSLDVTKYVDFDSYDIFIKATDEKIVDKGVLVPGASPLEVGKAVYIKYYWNVSNSNMKYITPGAFFTIDLPQNVFNFSAVIAGDKYAVLAGDQEIGTLTIVKSDSTATLKVVFNETAANAQSLSKGWLRADGSVQKVAEGTTTVAIGELEIPVKVDPENGGGSTTPTYKDGANINWGGGNSSKFFKGNSFNQYSGKATYTLYINNDQYQKAYSGDKITPMKNTLIEDELQEGIKYVDGTINAYARHYLAMGQNTAGAMAVEPGKMSDRYFSTSQLLGQFDHYVPADPTMDYADFKAAVAAKTKPTYGIWQNKKIVINLGDLPGNVYFEKSWKQLKADLDAASQTVTWTVYKKDADDKVMLDADKKPIVESTTTYEAYTPSVKLKTKQVFASLYNVPLDDMDNDTYDNNTGTAVGFYVSFTTQVTGADRTVKNEAFMYYGDEKISGKAYDIAFYSMSGGAEMGEPGDMMLIKKDGDNNDLLAGVEFKLQKWNKTTSEYEDLAAGTPGAGTHITSTDGSILFKELNWGQYKIIETKGAEGYTDKLTFASGDGTFEITGDETEVLQITALNYKEPTEEPTEEPGDVEGEEATPPAINGGDVLGEDANPVDEGSVLGEEAQTADASNMIPLLMIMLVVMLFLLGISLLNTRRQ